jgi:hypothetical protein
VALLSLLSVVYTSSVWADDKAEAKKHFENGLALISDEPKDFAAALVEFRQSVQLHPTKSGLFNLGLCYRRLSRFGEALRTFAQLEEEFGASLGEALRADVQREVAALRRLTAQLRIVVSQPDATVRVGGVAVGSSPLDKPLVLGPREHLLEVDLAGYQPVRRTLTLVAGERHTETVKLVALPVQLMVLTGGLEGATISFDGKPIAQSPMSAALPVAPGRHFGEVSKPGYVDSPPRIVDLRPGTTATLTFELALEPPVATTTPRREPRVSTLSALGIGTTATAGLLAGMFWFQADKRHDDFVTFNDSIARGEVRVGDANVPNVEAERQSAADDTELFSRLAVAFSAGAGVLAIATAVMIGFDLAPPDDEDERESGRASVEVNSRGLLVRF